MKERKAIALPGLLFFFVILGVLIYLGMQIIGSIFFLALPTPQ